MKLDDIIAKVATDNGMKKGDVKKVTTKVFDEIKAAVESGDSVGVPGVGRFTQVEREAGSRVGKDGATKTVEAAKYITLRPSRAALGRPQRETGSKKK